MSSQASIDKWSIPPDRLTGPRRTGGLTSLGGFDFQAAYACLHLTHLLDFNQGLIAIRYEGAQDVDLRYADGRERYVQLKNEPDAHYTLAKLRSVLQGFAADLLEAGRVPTLTFTLVARSNHIDAAAMRLRDGMPTPADIIEVAGLLIYSTQSSAAPQCLVSLDEATRLELADQLLKQTTFEFGMGDEIDGRLSFESHASTELARNGVAGKNLHDAFGVLKAALIPQREYTRADVQELLKRIVGGAAIDLFEGRVQALTDDVFASPASPERIHQYYAGAPLDWDIIAANGDIERDQQDELINQLSQPSETLRLVCIVAEPGAGKSTLAWRIAAELHRQYGTLVIRIRDKEAADLWYLMTDFYAKVGRPFCVLVDDLFRDPEVVNALRELSPSLPITILATSRANEYRPHRLKCEVMPVPLKEPSLGEKERILQRLGKTRVDLTTEQSKRLNTANQFLVLMMEITAGKELREIIRDTLERLRQQDESAYCAYEYLCFTFQHSISIPQSLLERLDAQGRFYNLSSRDTAQGLIFKDDPANHVRAGHAVIAEMCSRFYEVLRDPANVLREIVTTAESSNDLERRCVTRLLLREARAKSRILHSLLPQIEIAVVQCQERATINELVSSWRAFYRELGQDGQAERCVTDALTRLPRGSADCLMLLKLHRERGQEAEALIILTKWIREHAEDNSVRTAYLGLVERKGNAEQLKQVLLETSAWLAQHPEDNSVRMAYMGLVERKGNAEQVNQVLQETNAWLALHTEDNYVRTAYLGLVERRGNAEQLRQVLLETSAWLAQHPEDNSVRVAYTGLVERNGNAEQVKQVLQETNAWLALHTEDNYVRTAYMGLVERKGNAEQVRQVLQETTEWLALHTEDNNVRRAYLGLVERKGNAEQVERVLQETSAWLAKHSKDSNVRGRYLGLVERKGTSEQVEFVLQETSAWLAQHPENTNVRAAYLGLVERNGNALQVERVLRESSIWLAQHTDDTNVRGRYLGLLERQGTPEQVERVVRETSAWLAVHNGDTSVRMTYLGLVERKGDSDQVEQVLQETNAWLKQNKAAVEIWDALIALLIRTGRTKDAAEMALNAATHHPNSHKLAIHYLRFFRDSGDEQIVRKLYEKLMTTYPRDTNIPTYFAAWLGDHGYQDEALAIYDSLVNRVPRNFNVRYSYGRFLLNLEKYGEATRLFREALTIHRGYQVARDGLAQALRGHGNLALNEGSMKEASHRFLEAEREYRKAVYWAGVHKQPQAKFYTNLGWFYIERGRYTEALEAFESAIDESPDYFGNYWGAGRALIGLGQFLAAADALNTALEKAPEDFQPPASKEIPELLKQCQDVLQQDISDKGA